MPEIVRQHTHFHKVYKLVEPHASHPPTKWQPQPHVSLLGYTTTASGTGHLTSDLAQLISSVVAATPSPPPTPPNYGPALFDNKYLSEESASQSDTTVQPAAGKLLQQLFKPNVEVEPPHAHADSEPELEHNELLNSNFMAALQREYLSKFGSTSKPPKRKKPNNNNNNNSFLRVAKPKLKPKLKTKSKYKQQMEEYASNYLQDMQSGENFDEQTEEEEEPPPPTAYAEHYQEPEGTFEDEDEVVAHGDYDSATAFSTPNNGLSFLPTPDEFLNDIHSSNSYAGNTYSDLYDDYGPSPSGTGWKTVPRPTKPSLITNTKLLRHRQRRRPALDFMATGSSSGWAPSSIATGSGQSSSGAHHMRYPKLTNRSKRKNRIKSKTYRI